MAVMAAAEKASALKYYPAASEKKWAVLYSTWCGTARDAGVWISEGMGGIADVFDLREAADLKGFDNLIIGGAIRMGKVSPELEEYLKTNQAWLKDKIRGLYLVCGNMQQPVTPELVDKLINNYLAPLCGVKNVTSNIFLGRVTPILLEPGIREQMAGFGEYDNLKRPVCMALGKEILSKVSEAK